MTSPRMNGNAERLGTAHLSEEFSKWNEEWLQAGAPTKLLAALGKHTLVLDTLEYGNFSTSGARATFVENHQFGLGREDAKHEVKFGQMLLNGTGVHEQPEFVALKVFEEEDEGEVGLKREWTVTQYLNETLDDQFGVLPLGVSRDSEGNLVYISAYENSIKSLDNVLWANRNIEPEALRPRTVLKSIAMGFYGLGMMHGSRVIHHDAQVKNMAMDNRNARLIDLEAAEIIDKDEIDEGEALDKTRVDISAFVNSLTQVDENKEFILPQVKSHKTGAAVKSYRDGVRHGRAYQGGAYIPNFEKRNEDFIIDEIDSLR